MVETSDQMRQKQQKLTPTALPTAESKNKRISHKKDPVVMQGIDDRDTVYTYDMKQIEKVSDIQQFLPLSVQPATHVMYNMDKVIAHGTFGVVYECTSNQDKQRKVALKRVFQDARYKNRELEVLLDLNRLETGQLVQEVHPNILDCI